MTYFNLEDSARGPRRQGAEWVFRERSPWNARQSPSVVVLYEIPIVDGNSADDVYRAIRREGDRVLRSAEAVRWKYRVFNCRTWLHEVLDRLWGRGYVTFPGNANTNSIMFSAVAAAEAYPGCRGRKDRYHIVRYRG